MLVDRGKPEGKEPVRSSMGRCRHQPTQILNSPAAGRPRGRRREARRRGRKHKKIYRT
jgi:hypothetical protein